MKSHVGRLYAAAITLLVFFVSWALVATRPWAPEAMQDPRLARLEKREQRLKTEAVRVRKVVEQRWVVYHRRLARLKRELVKAEHGGSSGASPTVAVLASTPSSSGGSGGGSEGGRSGSAAGAASGSSGGGGGSSSGSGSASQQAAEPAPPPAEPAPPPPVTESGSS
jgi:hypothetical protein